MGAHTKNIATPSTWRVRQERRGSLLSSTSTAAHLAAVHPGFGSDILLFAMVAMATIVKPPAGIVPVANGTGIPARTNSKASCWSLSPRSQLRRFAVRAEAGETPSSVPASGTDDAGSLATEVKKPSPLQIDESAATPSQASKFDDPRWRAGTWDITKFTNNAKVDWDAIIDAEVARRKWLEENPEASDNSEPVVFDTGTVPWWAWVKRFHLPEAELINGRAAMVGFGVGYVVDLLTGAGLVDQQGSFLGKLLLLITVLGVLLIRKTGDVQNLRTIAKESTFYDKQWQATWKDGDGDGDGDSDNTKKTPPSSSP